jgi:hypothetical protein
MLVHAESTLLMDSLRQPALLELDVEVRDEIPQSQVVA